MATLTPEQRAEAEWEYIFSRLTDAERAHYEKLGMLKQAMERAIDVYDRAQSACTHPLIARETKNDGSTGNWDRNDMYWTDHKCRLCGKRWTTNQRWQHIGTKTGHPDDSIAREY